MDSRSPSPADRTGSSPFLLKVFYRTGAFHRPDEFSSPHLPPHLPVYTSPSCSLSDLVHHVAAGDPSLLPYPAIGTRLAFRLIYPDVRGGSGGAGRFVVKELGSVVIGEGGPGVTTDEQDADGPAEDNDIHKTLEDAKYVVGDYISCAILPPLANGAVAPAANARSGRGTGIGEGRPSGSAPISRRENGFGRGRGGRIDLGGSRGWQGRGGDNPAVPMGEWRRGERLPEAPSRGRGRGRDRR